MKKNKKTKGIKGSRDQGIEDVEDVRAIHELPVLEKKCIEFESGWKRALADYENLQKDMNSQLAKSRDRIKIDFVEQLIPVLDNFSQAVSFAPKTKDKEISNWLQGVVFIQKQFETVLSEMGVESIEATGKFNPALHEAVSSKTETDKEDQEILEIISPGWKLGATVIRPVKVIINEIEK